MKESIKFDMEEKSQLFHSFGTHIFAIYEFYALAQVRADLYIPWPNQTGSVEFQASLRVHLKKIK